MSGATVLASSSGLGGGGGGLSSVHRTTGTAGSQVQALIQEIAGLGVFPFLDIKMAS